MAKYYFQRVRTVEEILSEIGRPDIPSTEVTLSRPAIDPVTDEVMGELGIDFGSHTLSPADEAKLRALMETQGLRLKKMLYHHYFL